MGELWETRLELALYFIEMMEQRVAQNDRWDPEGDCLRGLMRD